MIEIDEQDHVIALTKDRLKSGPRDEAADYLDQLISQFKFGHRGKWTEVRSAQFSIRNNLHVDWLGLREEFVSAMNATLVEALNRRELERKGSKRGVVKRAEGTGFQKAGMLDDVRSIFVPGKSAEWHRQKMERLNGPSIGLRTMQRYLRVIRREN